MYLPPIHSYSPHSPPPFLRISIARFACCASLIPHHPYLGHRPNSESLYGSTFERVSDSTRRSMTRNTKLHHHLRTAPYRRNTTLASPSSVVIRRLPNIALISAIKMARAVLGGSSRTLPSYTVRLALVGIEGRSPVV